MDVVSAAASVIAVVQISAQVYDLCRTYYLEVKEARKDIKSLRDEMTSLQDVLTHVADLDDDSGSGPGSGPGSGSGSVKLSILGILNQQDGPVQQCQRDLLGIFAKLELGQGKNKMKQFGLRALKWPFSSKDVEKLLTTIERHKTTFNLALTADHVALARTIKGDIAKLNEGIEELQIGQRKFLADGHLHKIHQWLSPPDPSSNHNAACKKRQPTTGSWFIGGDQFEEWKTCPNSFLWLYGIPGCGKTILCSTIVQDVSRHYELKSEVAVAYFYFDFNDCEKQRHENLIRSLIVQLSSQSEKTPESLDALFTSCGNRQQQPATDSLRSTLKHIIGGFQQIFIILDALDECREREELLGLMEDIANWKLETLHILVTSRRERDIEETLETLVTGQICIQSALINADIQTHICERLQNDPKLRKWPQNVQMEIEKTLMAGAHGMFRWVVCQLDVLRKCLKLDALRKALSSLPKTLDDTYARILCNIDEEYSKDAFKILQWLAYSARPLRIEEVAEVVAVEIDDDPRFDPENRLLEPRDILTICSSLVTTATKIFRNGDEVVELRLAHFSVKEYLVSVRILAGPASQYAINICAEDRIAQTCLIYLLYLKGPAMLSTYRLARYAAEYWTQHARAAKNNADRTNELIMEILQMKNNAYINWIRLFDLDKPWQGTDMTRSLENIASPIYYAARADLIEAARLLLENGADLNAQGGYYGNALQAASRIGSEAVVRLLLEKGADVNAQGGSCVNALQAASIYGSKEVVKLLLKKGADFNAQGGHYGNALQAASLNGSEAVVRLLLEKGADVNAQGGSNGNALQAASINGSEAVVRLLLENGADLNAQGGFYGNALQAASRSGSEAVMRLLLEKGANVNIESGYFRNAL